MRAWRVEKHGGPEALRLAEMPDPVPGPGQVRIRVEAIGLNHLDLWVRKGVPGHKFPLPLTIGTDIAGTIDSLGPGAAEARARDGLQVGSPIIVNPGVSCGCCEACLGGFDPLCPRYGIIGEHMDGGAADFLCVPIANIITRPANLTAREAAALPIPFLTAWTMLTRKAAVKAGEIVLIQAGGSAVSAAAIQIAKLLGATVITTVGSEEKVERARALGADHVIQYRKGPFREELKRILPTYGRKGCEVVLDHVGADTFGESLKSLAWGGRLVTCGATSGSEVAIDLKAVFFKNISILGSTMGSKADLLRIVDLVSRGKLKAVIDSVHPFEALPAAMSRIENRSAFGKVIVENG
jgi:NADPH:quinone reductase-like Zn-dependent oxidoreductase